MTSPTDRAFLARRFYDELSLWVFQDEAARVSSRRRSGSCSLASGWHRPEVTAGRRRLAMATGLATSTVQDALYGLEERGLLERSGTGPRGVIARRIRVPELNVDDRSARNGGEDELEHEDDATGPTTGHVLESTGPAAGPVARDGDVTVTARSRDGNVTVTGPAAGHERELERQREETAASRAPAHMAEVDLADDVADVLDETPASTSFRPSTAPSSPSSLRRCRASLTSRSPTPCAHGAAARSATSSPRIAAASRPRGTFPRRRRHRPRRATTHAPRGRERASNSRKDIEPSVCEMWLKPLELAGEDGGELVLAVGGGMPVGLTSTRFGRLIDEALEGRPYRLEAARTAAA